ncbi:unnamed protein product [Tilletia controversa]|uniref:Uncharacterized protein n=2 Tax=Tilletia TaxID=13289 RepID=A0A8X7STK6_9BASI|nr:hypothetical protein CF336_g7674 [Tilletia laevis]KAE8186289.1 hypothetical protein CF328_g7277 [Tilletia controversa]CAD6886220.1 unnamed protein product [Tilletia caries]KAE8187571.1 hypothetical protein CF335_g7133 [Tilletia laevis]KAE8239811.1 hypothetical protein A4X06_0g8029 [Tilletia controversa]
MAPTATAASTSTSTSTSTSPASMDGSSIAGPSSRATPSVSPSSAAILAAAKQRRMLLRAAEDPSLLDEFGPLGAPSPSKDARGCRRRVVSDTARLSLGDPLPSLQLNSGDGTQPDLFTQSRFQDYYSNIGADDSANKNSYNNNTAARAEPSQHTWRADDKRHQPSQALRHPRQDPQKGYNRQMGTASSPSLRRNAQNSSSLAPSSSQGSDKSSLLPDPSSSSGPYLHAPNFVVISSSSSSEQSSDTSSPALAQSSTFQLRAPQQSVPGSRSVSEPYVTHDFDEMLPPAIARRLEQQRLMALDPRLSRVEGLIDTWDRNGLPLSTRDLWQQQQREKEEAARKQKEQEKAREEQERAEAEAEAEERQGRRPSAVEGQAQAETDSRAAQMRRQRILAQRALQQQKQYGQEDDSRDLAAPAGGENGEAHGEWADERGHQQELQVQQHQEQQQQQQQYHQAQQHQQQQQQAQERHAMQPLDPNVRQQPYMPAASVGANGDARGDWGNGRGHQHQQHAPEQHAMQPLDANWRRQPSAVPTMGSEVYDTQKTLESTGPGSKIKRRKEDKVESGCGCVVM